MKTEVLTVLAVVALTFSPAHGGLVDGFFQKAFDQLRPKLKDVYRENAALQNLTLKNLFITGLDEFYTTALSVNLIPLKINNMTIVIDDIKAEGSYRMDKLQLPGPIELSGAGDMRLRVTGIKLYIKATLSSYQQKMYIKEIQDMSVYVDTIELHMTGLAGGGSVGDLLSNILNIVAKPLFNMAATPALLANRAQLIPVLNDVLGTIVV